MRRVTLTSCQVRELKRETLATEVEQEILKLKIKKKDLANLAGISERALYEMFKKKNISLDVFVAAKMLIEEKREKTE